MVGGIVFLGGFFLNFTPGWCFWSMLLFVLFPSFRIGTTFLVVLMLFYAYTPDQEETKHLHLKYLPA